MMDNLDDTEHWANIAAEELARALELCGIGAMEVIGESNGDVAVAFPSLADAEALMTLAVPQSTATGKGNSTSTGRCWLTPR